MILKRNISRVTLLVLALVGFAGLADARSRQVNPFDLNSALEKENVWPVVVIGSGPAGLGAALYTSRERKTLVLEGNEPGGLLTKTSEVDNWLGEKSILGKNLIDKLKEHVKEVDHAASAGVTFLADAVASVDFSEWPYQITTEEGTVIYALSVVIATGATPRTLGVPGEQQYWGAGVTTCAICDAPFYKGSDVVVVGGGDSAIEEATQLAPYAKSIAILVRKSEMAAKLSMQQRLADYPSISVVHNVEVQEIVGDGSLVNGVQLLNNLTGKTYLMPTAGVFLAIGHTPNSQLFEDYLAIGEHGHIIMTGRTQQTSLEGVFAAGEVEDDRYRQAKTSAGDGTKAGLDALTFLREIGLNATVEAQLIARTKKAQSNSMPLEIEQLETLQAFKQAVGDAQGLAVLYFYLPNCPTCMQMEPVVNFAAQQLEETATFFKVNADQAVDITKKFKVKDVPQLLVFKDGKKVEVVDKVISKQELLARLNQNLKA